MTEPEKKTIAFSSRLPEILFRVETALEKAGYNVISCLTDKDSLLHIKRSQFDAFVIGAGVSEENRKKILAGMLKEKPDAILIEESGGPEDVLRAVRLEMPAEY